MGTRHIGARRRRNAKAILELVEQQARAGDVDAQAYLAAREPRELLLFERRP